MTRTGGVYNAIVKHGSFEHSSSGLPTVDATAPTIRLGLETIDKYSVNAALVIDRVGTLVGVVTDGDLRRAILKGASMEDSLLSFITKTPVVAGELESRASVMDLMLSRAIDQVPIVNSEGKLMGLHTLRQLLGRENKVNPTLILAGGRGTRLGRETQTLPKPMLRVAGRPILERLINHCIGFGFTNITLSVSYRADDIVNYFGDGTEFGCTIGYLHDPAGEPRGTGGPFVDLARSKPHSEHAVLVLNGDLVTDANLAALVDEHISTGALMTIAVHDYFHEVPFGTVSMDETDRVSHVEEKPTISVPVSAGIYVLSPLAAIGFPPRGLLPMTDIMQNLLQAGSKVQAFPVGSDWIDVGTPRDLRRARGRDHI